MLLAVAAAVWRHHLGECPGSSPVLPSLAST